MNTYANWQPHQAHNGNANTLRLRVLHSPKIINSDILQLLNIFYLTKCVSSPCNKCPLIAIEFWSTNCWLLLSIHRHICMHTNTGSVNNRHNYHIRHNALLSSFIERSLINTHYAKLKFSWVQLVIALQNNFYTQISAQIRLHRYFIISNLLLVQCKCNAIIVYCNICNDLHEL